MDWTEIAAGISSQITTGLPAFTILIGLVVGIPLAWRLIRKITK